MANPRRISLTRTLASKITNTVGFPQELQTAIAVNPAMAVRRFDLASLSGQLNRGREGAYVTVFFDVTGIEEATQTQATYRIDVTLEIETARAVAGYLEMLADQAETMS